MGGRWEVSRKSFCVCIVFLQIPPSSSQLPSQVPGKSQAIFWGRWDNGGKRRILNFITRGRVTLDFSSSCIWPAGHRATRVCQVGHVFWKLAFIYLFHHNCHLFSSIASKPCSFSFDYWRWIEREKSNFEKKYKRIDHDFSSGKRPREE